MIEKSVKKQVSYASPTPEVYIETLSKAGLPIQFAQITANFAKAISIGEFYVEKTDLEMLLGRKPITLKEFLKTSMFL